MIEVVNQSNIHEVLPLIRQYMEFYRINEIDDERNRAFFSQFGESNPSGCLFLYRNDIQLAVAFATVYFTHVSSITAKVAVMNDLFTLESERGKGIGRQLINHCLDFALSKGAARLQWLTALDNHPAQMLYDSLPSKKSTWHVYTYRP